MEPESTGALLDFPLPLRTAESKKNHRIEATRENEWRIGREWRKRPLKIRGGEKTRRQRERRHNKGEQERADRGKVLLWYTMLIAGVKC